MRFFGSRRQFDLERELRASRPRARAEFVDELAAEVRSRPAPRTRLGRVGLALALSGLIVVALVSFGGVGYASSAARHAVKKPSATAKSAATASSAAQAQYGNFEPKTQQQEPQEATVTQVKSAGQAANVAPAAKSGQLPFTGLALWIPLAGGLFLIAFGLALRTRGRRRDSTAH